jgi:sulfate transport system ATP-binding protein
LRNHPPCGGRPGEGNLCNALAGGKWHASFTASGDIIEAHIAAQQFGEMALKDGEILMLTPRRAKVFVAQS